MNAGRSLPRWRQVTCETVRPNMSAGSVQRTTSTSSPLAAQILANGRGPAPIFSSVTRKYGSPAFVGSNDSSAVGASGSSRPARRGRDRSGPGQQPRRGPVRQQLALFPIPLAGVRAGRGLDQIGQGAGVLAASFAVRLIVGMRKDRQYASATTGSSALRRFASAGASGSEQPASSAVTRQHGMGNKQRAARTGRIRSRPGRWR